MRNINDTLNHQTSQANLTSLDIKLYSLTESESLVHNQLLGMGNITYRIFVSQTYLAKKLGFSRATINRALGKLSSLGLIQKIDRGWKEERTRIKKTCYYIVSPLFDIPEIRKRYRHKFKSLNYQKLISNFEQITSSGYKHCIENVTGIKYFPNCLFINKHILPTGIKYQRRKSLRYSSTIPTMVDNVLTIRKSTVQKSRLKNVVSLQREKVSKLNNSIAYKIEEFNEELKRQASVFPDNVILYGLEQLKGKKDLFNPAGYFLGICTRKCLKDGITYDPVQKGKELPKITLPIRTNLKQSNSVGFQPKRVEDNVKVVPTESITDLEKERLHKRFKAFQACLSETKDPRLADNYQLELERMKSKYPYLFGNVISIKKPIETAVYIANEIATFLSHNPPNNIHKPELEKIRENCIRRLLQIQYTLTHEPDEQLAIEYIMHKRKKYQQPSQQITAKAESTVAKAPDTFEFEPESITPNESDFDEVLD